MRMKVPVSGPEQAGAEKGLVPEAGFTAGPTILLFGD
jgi:hypothetical protein